MVIEKCNKLYVCCGRYIATLDSVKNNKICCPICGEVLNKSISLPIVLIAKRS